VRLVTLRRAMPYALEAIHPRKTAIHHRGVQPPALAKIS
jgi:hypothetical protein